MPPEQRPTLSALLTSRTSPATELFTDDFSNHGDWGDWGPFAAPIDTGDHSDQPSVVLPG